MDHEQFLLEEYKYWSDSFWKNEEIGEKRVNFFITLATATLGAVIALATKEHNALSSDEIRKIATAALTGLAILGFWTFLRMLQRDRVTEEYKDKTHYLRNEIKRRSLGLTHYDPPFLPKTPRLFRGGLAETVAVMNGLILATIVALWHGSKWGWIVACFLVGSLPLHHLLARASRILSNQWELTRARFPFEKEPPSQTFRAGVGAVISNRNGNVLALQRTDVPDSWQFPQGGLWVNEEPLDAAKREVCEETGINADNLQLLTPEPRLLVYELPKENQSVKTGRGQAQYWFFFRYTGGDEDIIPDKKEFKSRKWVSMDQMVSMIVRFKKPLYEELAKEAQRLEAHPQ